MFFLEDQLRIFTAISPAALGANQNDWNPTSLATAAVIRADGSAAVNITGLAGGAAGRLLWLTHVGTNAANTLTLTHEDAASTAANRFLLPNADRAGGTILAIGNTVKLWYDITSSRWRVLGKAF